MTGLTYPAVLVISRGPTKARNDVFVCLDDKVLHDQAELGGRLLYLENLARLGGVSYYTHTPAPLEAAEATAATIRADLERKHGLAAEPETPAQPAQADPLAQAYELGRQRWEGDPGMLGRLDRALEIVKAGSVKDLGNGEWEVAGQSGKTYRVNGACQCGDYTGRGVGWCKHRLAVALVRRAAELQKAAGSAENTPAAQAPEGTPDKGEHSTDSRPGQIELVIVYETDEAREHPRIHNGGELVTFKADGQPADPPTRDLGGLYKWLQAQGYAPAAFSWLGRAVGYKRQRRQVYSLAGA